METLQLNKELLEILQSIVAFNNNIKMEEIKQILFDLHGEKIKDNNNKQDDFLWKTGTLGLTYLFNPHVLSLYALFNHGLARV